jgi:hypothetical protein
MPTNFPQGISTAGAGDPAFDLGVPDPTKWIVFFDDFHRYLASDWVITTTEAGAGDATEALTDAQGGALLITNDAADNDADFFQTVGESFYFVAGKKTIFKARFKTNDATNTDLVFGLQIRDTTPLAVSDGVYFRKDDDDAYLDFVVVKNSTATTATAVATLASNTWTTVAFCYDGKDAIHYYVNDVRVGQSVTTNLCDDEELTVSFGIQNGAAAAKTLTVDYILAAQER